MYAGFALSPSFCVTILLVSFSGSMTPSSPLRKQDGYSSCSLHANGFRLNGERWLAFVQKWKTLLLCSLFCITVFGSQASSHAQSWVNRGAGVRDTLIDFSLVCVLWCDAYFLCHIERPWGAQIKRCFWVCLRWCSQMRLAFELLGFCKVGDPSW